MQRNKQVAMGRKKFNMDPKKVSAQEAAGAHSRLDGVVCSAQLEPRGAAQLLCPFVLLFWPWFLDCDPPDPLQQLPVSLDASSALSPLL